MTAALATATSSVALTGPLVNGFASCMSSDQVNTPYCPHTAGNAESPVANAVYPLGSYIRLSWNSQWSPFATVGSVDVYLCPGDKPTNCLLMSTLDTKLESTQRMLDAKALTPGPYFYVVVPLGDSPSVPFVSRGPAFTIAPAPVTSTSTTSTSSPTRASTATVTAIVSATSASQSSPPAPDSNKLTPLTIGLIAGISALLVLIAGGFIVSRHRKRNRARPVKATMLSPGGGGSGNGAGTSSGDSLTALKRSGSASGGVMVAAAASAGSPSGMPSHGLTSSASNDTLSAGSSPYNKMRKIGSDADALYVPAGDAPSSSPVPAGLRGLPSSNGSPHQPQRLVAAPVSGAISSTEAILIANSFKLALKKSIEPSDDDDDDISATIDALGMRPVPDGSPRTPAQQQQQSFPGSTPTSASLGAAVSPATFSSGLEAGSRPSMLSLAFAPRPSSLQQQQQQQQSSRPFESFVTPASPTSSAVPPRTLAAMAAATHPPGTSSPLASADSLMSGPAAAGGPTSNSYTTLVASHHDSIPRSVGSNDGSLPRNTALDTMTVSRVSIDSRDRETALLQRAPLKQVGSNPRMVLIDPSADGPSSASAQGSSTASPSSPPLAPASATLSPHAAATRVSVVPELHEAGASSGSSRGNSDAESVSSLQADRSA
ncbi:hypothetical protein BC828DRAFT_404803 [Blastocladiella britannica]|nr:hypothetical protein BC828DRAFT_404803 [Blastocladiella britannica]